ncbi:MAG: hypothetical protein WCK98_04065 [bacterium]
MNKKITLIILIILPLIVSGLLLWQNKIYLINEFVLRNTGYYLPCDKIISTDEAERIFNKNTDEIKNIESKYPGFISISLVQGKDENDRICQGKSALEVVIGADDQRQEIKRQFGDSFHGIPYEIINR